jgi:excinuclease ABC subunit C
MREGKLIGRDVFRTEIYGPEEEALIHFLLQYYSDIHNPPGKIYVEIPFGTGPIETFFSQKMGRKVDIFFPEEGPHYSILKMAKENSNQDLEKRVHQQQIIDTLQELKEVLSLPSLPRRIEGFDISQLSGKYPVASMVTFYNGVPEKKNYRHYHMRSLQGGIDDYEAIREVVARRYTRVINENAPKPDLILIDGGKGQVNAAREILVSLDLTDIPVYGLAKQKEEIVPIQGKSILLNEDSLALRLLQHVRDESHRFATTFNKKLRKKDLAFSQLERIPGIGRQRSRKLLETYGSIAALVESTPEDIAGSCGFSENLAREVLSFLKGKSGKG